MGNLFYRGVMPAELKGMSFEEMRYWNEWHLKISEAERPPRTPHA
jgi:hypothetical protein